MNKVINQILLAADKFIPEIYLRQLGFIYIDCGRFNRSNEGIQIFKRSRTFNMHLSTQIK